MQAETKMVMITRKLIKNLLARENKRDCVE